MSRREGIHVPAVRAANEKNLGITQRCTPINFAWNGDVRKRYTDFLVYEIRKDGSVVHLDDYEVDEEQEKLARNFALNGHSNNRNSTTVGQNNGRIITDSEIDPRTNRLRIPGPEPTVKPEPITKQISEEDKNALASLLSEATAEKLIDLDQKVQARKQIPSDERSVIFDPIMDRSQRAVVHQEIRRIFESRLETLADSTGIITAVAAKFTGGGRNGHQNQNSRREGNRPTREAGKSFGQLGGDYLHFTLYKENKDTMDAINTIARLLKIKASNFGFAGTKDRRAGTVQRVSIYRQRANNMIWLNSRLPNVKVGDFGHSKVPLQLGQHGGNEFIITIKNCQPMGLGASEGSVEQRMRMIQSSVETGLAYLKHHGYLNYFGLQRFGTYSIGTHSLGMKILKGDYESAIDDILNVEEEYFQDVLANKMPQGHGPMGDSNRDDFYRAKAITTWKATKNAAKAIECLPKRFSSELAIIRHLSRNTKDFMGAILSITRGMRMMYIHAYQSYVWNFVATRRWSKYGATLIEGDLVLENEKGGGDTIEGDVNDTEIVDEADSDDIYYARARPLTAEDIASGKYTIFDIVLPTPGYDVSYPLNNIGEYYAEFMGREENGGLDPHDMRRRHKEFSLSGNYRHLIGRFITEPEYAIRLYSDDTQQLYPTDLDICNHNKKLAAAEKAREDGLASGTPPPEVAASAARWTHFAQNAAQYDGIMAEDRRRKASESPSADVVITTKETWVQTGMDGSDKRVKLARHHDTTETEVKQSSPVAGNGETNALAKELPETSPKDSAEISDPSKSNETTNDEEMKDAPPPTSAAIKEEDDTTPTVEPKSVSEAYYEAMSKANGTGSVDPLNWYGGMLPTVPFPNVVKPESPGDGVANVEEGSTVTKIGKIVLPAFRKPSDNPIISVNDFSHEIASNPDATKIAVVLKFQLKCSNYATIVLRELMGTGAEDSVRPSSGNGIRASSVGFVRPSSVGGSRAPSESA